jgi:hypothetical protein
MIWTVRLCVMIADESAASKLFHSINAVPWKREPSAL